MQTNIAMLHLDQIKILEGRNPRLALNGVEELANSILENGVVTPIKVEMLPNVDGKGTKNQYQLVDGHRRLAACQYLLEQHQTEIDIPAMLVVCRDEADTLVQMLVSNDSEPFTPFEEALMFQRLKTEFKLTVQQIADRCGRSASHVSDKFALLRADVALQEAVKNGEVSPADANTIIRKSKGDKENQREVTQRVLDEGREEVVEKELLRGRMPKIAWAEATTTYDQLWTAALPLGGVKNVMEQTDSVEKLVTLKGQPEELVELAYYAGKMSAFTALSHLTFSELWKKLEERNNI